jgi:hypothetical protein
MSSCYIYQINLRQTPRLILVLMICLTLMVGCRKTEPALIAIPSSATPIPSKTQTLQSTQVSTGMTTETATPSPKSEVSTGARTYGGKYNDYLFDILLLADGGTLIAGQANNTGPSARISPGIARLIRTDSEGDIIWEKDYGGDDDAMLYSLIQVGEDEYVALGQIAASYSRDEMDMFLIKIDGQGNEIWSHTYGGRGMDHAKMVRQASDGGYVLIGSRADEFPTDGQYEADVVLIKTDAEGNEVWTRTYGDKILSVGWGVEPTPDGGYVLIGWEAKTYPDRDVIAIKTNEMGDIEWFRTWDLDPGDRDGGYDLILTSDGHIVIACIQSMNSGARGAVLVKVDLDGNEIWVKDYGEEGVGNEFWDIMEDTDGGYIMAGDTLPGDVSSTGEDIRNGLVIKTDPNGEILWQYIFEMDEYELQMFSSAVVLPDGEYILVGRVTLKGERYADMLWLKLTNAGDVIAFTSERDGNAEIYIMNSDGSNPQRLTNDPAYDAWPVWSPDGSQIAFMSDRSGNPDIYVMDADGNNVRQLTYHSANDIWPDWSPDGTRIAFPSRRDGNFEIYVINPDGTNLQRLTNTPSHEDFPVWSPDGESIVFSRIQGNDGTFIMNADGSDERKLTGIIALEPSWSPDGKRIAFGSDHEGFRGINMMDADGSNIQRLSSTRTGENCPEWSPDGTRILFASWRDGDGEIYVMDVNGSNLQKLTDNRFEEEFPAWRPALVPHTH